MKAAYVITKGRHKYLQIVGVTFTQEAAQKVMEEEYRKEFAESYTTMEFEEFVKWLKKEYTDTNLIWYWFAEVRGEEE